MRSFWNYFAFILIFTIGIKHGYGQNFTEILGRPTGTSVTLSILSDKPADIYWEYGTAPGNYPFSTIPMMLSKDIPVETEFPNLTPNLRYYYRTRYRAPGSSSAYLSLAEHTFQTARPRGSVFTFAIEADPHLDENSNTEAYSLTLNNILSINPDFLIDLGDTFFSEKQPGVNQAIVTERHLLYRPYFGSVCHSVPLYLALGNHEGEAGWRLDGTANNVAVMAVNTRKLYYPNPVPNAFYSGNKNEEEFVGLNENYYAWEWGDALIVVLDPYWYTVKKPGWGWTLGVDQYNWFKNTLEASKAKYKFVFCHNLVGGDGNDARGGAEFAHLFEMGGSNIDGSWGFDVNRPGWGKPIHTLMVENKVNIFFHGHDHFYGKQEKDGVIYQEVPQPSNRNITNVQTTEYGYVNGLFLPGRGYLSVTVEDDGATVKYIRTCLPTEENATRKNKEVADSYTVKSGASSAGPVNGLPLLKLEQNFPNPFQSETIINFEIAGACQVQLFVTDSYGRVIKSLVNQYKPAGRYSFALHTGDPVLPVGIYYIVLRTAGEMLSRRMIKIA